MASPTTLGGVGMAAIGSFPVGGSTDPLKSGIFLFLDGVDLAAENRFQSGSLELSDAIGSRDHLEFLYQLLAGGAHLKPGQRVILRQDTVNLFLGTIDRLEEVEVEGNVALFTRVEVVGLTSILERRLVTAEEVYTNQLPGDIVKDLLSTYLTGEAITTNSVQNGTALGSFTVEAFWTVLKALEELSKRTGFIFFVDANGDLHFEAQTAAMAPFDVGSSTPDEVPLGRVTIRQDRQQYRNRQTVRYGADLDLSVTQDDTAEQAARAAVEGNSGIYHAVQDAKEIVTSAEATALADALLRRFGKIPMTVRFATRRQGLVAGQSIALDFPEHGINATFLIDQVNVREDAVPSKPLVWDVTALSGEHQEDPMAFWRRTHAK